MEELNYDKKTIIVKDYIGTHEELIEAITTEVIINKFRGGFEVNDDILNQDIPETFTNSKKISIVDKEVEYETITFDENGVETIITNTKTIREYELDEEGNHNRINKTWRDYAIHFPSLTFGKTLIMASNVLNSNNNYDGSIHSVDLYLWINELGVDNILTKSDFYSLVKKTDTGIE
jgi:hypothetical protein